MRRRSPSYSVRRATRSKYWEGSMVSGTNSPAIRSSAPAATSRSFIASPSVNPGLGCELRPLDGPLGGKFRNAGRSRGRSVRLGNGRNRRVFEEIHHATLPLGPHAIHPARAQQEAIGMLAHTHIERDRSFHRLDDVPDGHLVGRPTEYVASVGTAPGPHQSLVDQLLHDLLEKLPRD